ncbi:MAG TPA: hypothetical protein VIY29_15500 [Ktedonobacteraceae bacterium]
MYQQALAAGAVSVTEMTSLVWGERGGRVRDPLGNIWWIQTQVEQVSQEEIAKRVTEKQRSEQFGQDYGLWLNEWHLLQRSVFVIDRNDSIVYVEYVADQLREPDYAAALQAVQQAAME